MELLHPTYNWFSGAHFVEMQWMDVQSRKSNFETSHNYRWPLNQPI